MKVRPEIFHATHYRYENLVQFNFLFWIYYKKFNKNIIRFKQKLMGKINNGLSGTKTKLLDSSVDREWKP